MRSCSRHSRPLALATQRTRTHLERPFKAMLPALEPPAIGSGRCSRPGGRWPEAVIRFVALQATAVSEKVITFASTTKRSARAPRLRPTAPVLNRSRIVRGSVPRNAWHEATRNRYVLGTARSFRTATSLLHHVCERVGRHRLVLADSQLVVVLTSDVQPQPVVAIRPDGPSVSQKL